MLVILMFFTTAGTSFLLCNDLSYIHTSSNSLYSNIKLSRLLADHAYYLFVT